VSGIAGYNGMDGITHQWWWDEFEKWQKERRNETELLRVIAQNMVGSTKLSNNDMAAIGTKVNDPSSPRIIEKAISVGLKSCLMNSIESSDSSECIASIARSKPTLIIGSDMRNLLSP
jgi:hypothetical protein